MIASDDAGIGWAVVVKLLRCGGLAIQSRARWQFSGGLCPVAQNVAQFPGYDVSNCQ